LKSKGKVMETPMLARRPLDRVSVSRCCDCPYLETDGGAVACGRLDAVPPKGFDRWRHTAKTIDRPPAWCPLRDADVLISISEAGA
jgi:hypothetical protein